MIAAIFEFFKMGSALSKLVIVGSLLLSLIEALGVLVHEHDNRVRAEVQASLQVQQLKDLKADDARHVKALQQNAADVASIAAASMNIRSKIDAAPKTTACIRSPSVTAVLDGLRQPASGSRAAPARGPLVPSEVFAAPAGARPGK